MLDIGKFAGDIQKKAPWIANTVLQEMLGVFLPFNNIARPKFVVWDRNQCEVSVKVKRKLRNHLGGLHAGATATIGEYVAGLTLIRNFSTKEYRLILKELNVVYKKQAKDQVRAKCEITKPKREEIIENLKHSDEVNAKMETHIYRKDGEEIAVIRTFWQIKSWSKVRKR